MKNILLIKRSFGICLICCLPFWSLAQIHIDSSAIVHISNGAMLYSELDIRATNSSQLSNEGLLSTQGSIHNENESSIQGNGVYELAGDWNNTASFSAASSIVHFLGANNSTITSSGASFHKVELNKSGASIVLNDQLTLNAQFDFLAANNNVMLNDQVMLLQAVAEITGYDESSYVVTGSIGELQKAGLGNQVFTFPVGYDNTSFNPISIKQNGTADHLGVRCLAQHFENGNSGNPFTTEAVDASWQITHHIAGENDMEVMLFWKEEHELEFDRDNCAIGLWDGFQWDHGTIDGNPAESSANYFFQTREGITNSGILGIRSGMGLVDIEEIIAKEDQIKVFPTPFIDQITVLNAYQSVQIFSVTGQMILQKQLSSNIGMTDPLVLNLSYLPAGTYILKTADAEGRIVNVKLSKVD